MNFLICQEFAPFDTVQNREMKSESGFILAMGSQALHETPLQKERHLESTLSSRNSFRYANFL